MTALRIERRIEIKQQADVMRSTMLARAMVKDHCQPSEQVLMGTVCSELATNLLRYAGGGFILLQFDPQQRLFCIESDDQGPGIANIEKALQEGFSTSKGLGAGLAAIQRIMDSLKIHNKPERGLYIQTQCKLRTSRI